MVKIAMDEYQLREMLHEDESLRLRVFDLATTERKGQFVVKQYTCSRYEEADRLLKEAIVQVRQPFPLWAALIAIRLAPVADSSDFTVNFIYKKFQNEFSAEVMKKSDRDDRYASGLQCYEKRGLLTQKKGNINVEVHDAWSSQLKREVVMKTFTPIFEVAKANLLLKEAFVQAQVEHPNNCCILDIALCAKESWNRGFNLHIIMEKLSKDMQEEIAERKGRERNYIEEELLTFLSQVTAGLIQAKSKVINTQRIAHRDIKPSNIFVGSDGTYKVGDFGCAWEKTLLTLTSSYAGTILYFSPEMRKAHLTRVEVDSFASDVFSLGITVMHLATLEEPNSLNTDDPELLQARIKTVLDSLQYSQAVKALLAEMLNLDPAQRPILEAVFQTVNELLNKPQLGDSVNYWAMTREQLAIEERKVTAKIRSLQQSAEGDELADAYLLAAKIAKAQNSFEKAEDFALKCTALTERTLGPTHSRTADAYSFTAFLYFRNMGRFAEAERLCRSSLRIYERSNSQHYIAETCFYLCSIYKELGKFGEAEEFGVRSQRAYEQLYGTHSPHTALAYNCLSKVYRRMGRLEEAERFALKDLTITQEVYGKTHTETATSYNNLYLVYSDMRRFEEAEKCALKSLQIYQRVFGENHLNTASTCCCLCRLYQDTGRLEEAERFGVKSLSIQQQLYGDIHPSTALISIILSSVYRDMGRLEQAEELARKAVRTYERLTSFDPSDLARAREILEGIIKRRSTVNSRK